jgi:hypothetical protein
MEKASWEAVEAVGTWVAAFITLIMAAVTAFMAYLTREAVEESKKQRYEARQQFTETRKREAQHHQDQFRPLLVVVPPGDGAPTDRMGFVTTSDPNEERPSVFVTCTVRNIGVGPALNVRLSVRKDQRTGFGPARELAPIAANDTLQGSDGPFRLPVIYHDRFNKADLHTLAGGLWILVLEYEDVFGNMFHTLHRKNQGAMWTQANRDAAPDTTPPALFTDDAPEPLATGSVSNGPGLLL